MMSQSLRSHENRGGVPFALLSAALLGIAPIFGKQALILGLPAFTLVAGRTLGATLLLLFAMLIFRRRFLYIYPIGLLGCLLAGFLNGVGSLFYYSALARIDASLGQLLFSFYPAFIALLLYLDGQQPTRLTILRLALSLPAVFLLTRTGITQPDVPGAVFMLVASLFFALHIPINQRILYDVPAPTVTLYTLAAMTLVVVPAHLITQPPIPLLPQGAWGPLLGLTLVTFFSRLTLFAGVKRIGGGQTALLGLSELLITIALAHLFLGESLSLSQWAGAALLMGTLLLTTKDRQAAARPQIRGWLFWLRPLPPTEPAVDPLADLHPKDEHPA